MENSQINYTAASDESKALYHDFLIKCPAIYVVRRKLILFSQFEHKIWKEVGMNRYTGLCSTNLAISGMNVFNKIHSTCCWG